MNRRTLYAYRDSALPLKGASISSVSEEEGKKMPYTTTLTRQKVRLRRIRTKFESLLSQTCQTLSDEYPTLVALIVIACVLLFLNYAQKRGTNETNNFFEGLFVEVAGTLILFVFLNRSIRSIAGIGVHDRLPIEAFIYAALSARREVRVLETFTDLVNNDRYREQFRIAIQQTLNRRVPVRVLLIHPESSSAAQRADDLRGQVDVTTEINRTVQRFYTLTRALRSPDLSVRLYDSSLSVALHMWDDHSYVSFFPVDQRSDTATNLEVTLSTPLGRSVSQQFDQLWDAKTTVPIEEYMDLHLLLAEGSQSQVYRLHFYKVTDAVYYVCEPDHPRFADPLRDGLVVTVRVSGSEFNASCTFMSAAEERREAIALLEARYERQSWLTNASIVRLDRSTQETMT